MQDNCIVTIEAHVLHMTEYIASWDSGRELKLNQLLLMANYHDSTLSCRSVGCPRKSVVWDYFDYDQEKGRSRCKISYGSGEAKECGVIVNGKFTTNLKNHLRKHHPQKLKEVEEKDRKKEKPNEDAPSSTFSGISKGQLTLHQSLQAKKKYDSNQGSVGRTWFSFSDSKLIWSQ